MAELTEVQLYTDGACSGNPGPGGYGAILRCKGYEKEISGGEAKTTNNRMELMAVIRGLEALNRRCRVTIYSDSKYFVDAVEKGWAKSWKKNGWRNASKQPAKNPDLWEKLLTLLDNHEVKLVWLKGHAGHPENERCDRMAVAESKKFQNI